MGSTISHQSDLSSSEHLKQFVAKEVIHSTDLFWLELTSFTLKPFTVEDELLQFEVNIKYFLEQLATNNSFSGNFGTLIDVFLERCCCLSTICENKVDVYKHISNTIFIIKTTIRFLSKISTESQLIEYIEYGGSDRLENLISSLFTIISISDGPNRNLMYWIQLEALSTLIILMSQYLQTAGTSNDSRIYDIIMQGAHTKHSPAITQKLLENYMSQLNAPPYYDCSIENGIVSGLASGLWSILTFRSGNASSNDSSAVERSNCGDSLSTHSLLLLLILVHHWTTQMNPYRLCLFTCTNRNDVILDSSKQVEKRLLSTRFQIDFDALYMTLCRKSPNDNNTLLLYLMLHQNANFKNYVLSRTDYNILVIPILEILYDASNNNSHHIYMCLIIILILSENADFNRRIHEMVVKHISWYTERTLSDVTLGGLIILVVIRTIQYNMLKMRDKYLHTNCLATLANMSSKFSHLTPYVSQRIVAMFELLAKRHQRLTSQLQANQCSTRNGGSTDIIVDMPPSAGDKTVTVELLSQDLDVIEDVMRMLLEILNSCLVNQLANNPHLLYTLLYNKKIFESLQDHTSFEDIIYNINVVIRYFSEMLTANPQKNEVDANQVLSFIVQTVKYWPKDRLTQFPELKFKYVEEEYPENFFIPYVWTLVCRHPLLITLNKDSPFLSIC